MRQPIGLYRDEDNWAVVRYGTYKSVLPKPDYDELEITPAFRKLPTKPEYDSTMTEALVDWSRRYLAS